MAKRRRSKRERNRQHVAAAVPAEASRAPQQEMGAVGMARALSGTVAVSRGSDGGRLTLDRPDLAMAAGWAVLPVPDADLDWRLEHLDGWGFGRRSPAELLELLADASPDVSRALWDLLRFCNPGWDYTATRPGSQTQDKRAQANLDLILEALKSTYGTADIVFGKLFFGAFLRGAFFGELVLDPSGLAVDVATPDPKSVRFESVMDPVRGQIWRPFQWQQANKIYLDIPTIRYVPVDPAPGSPYGRPLATPAIFVTLFALGLLHDLRRVVAQQGYPRLDITVSLEAIKKALPAALQGDMKKLQEVSDSLCQQIAAHYSTLKPDDAYVHNDAIIMNKPQGTVDTSSLGAIDGLVKYLEKLSIRALKVTPLAFGVSEGLSEASANRLAEGQAASYRSLQHLCESLLEYLFELGLQSMGTPASVSFKFAEIRKAEELRDQQTLSLKLHNAALAYYLGFADLNTAAQMAEFDKADQEEPRLPGVGVQAAQGAGLAGSNSPAAAVAEPGQARGLLDGLLPALNGNGHARDAA